jgi:hypothetical protein
MGSGHYDDPIKKTLGVYVPFVFHLASERRLNPLRLDISWPYLEIRQYGKVAYQSSLPTLQVIKEGQK